MIAVWFVKCFHNHFPPVYEPSVVTQVEPLLGKEKKIRHSTINNVVHNIKVAGGEKLCRKTIRISLTFIQKIIIIICNIKHEQAQNQNFFLMTKDKQRIKLALRKSKQRKQTNREKKKLRKIYYGIKLFSICIPVFSFCCRDFFLNAPILKRKNLLRLRYHSTHP